MWMDHPADSYIFVAGTNRVLGYERVTDQIPYSIHRRLPTGAARPTFDIIASTAFYGSYESPGWGCNPD